MNWLNIRTEFLRSPKVAGIDPVALATWLRVLAYCCEQENGGVIEGGNEWTDRQWMASCSVHLREIKKCPLITFTNSAACIEAYPVEKESEVRAKRESGRAGGRAKAIAHLLAQPVAVLEANPVAVPQAELLRKENGIGKEVEGEGNGSAPPSYGACPTLEEWIARVTPANEWEETWWTQKFHRDNAKGWMHQGEPIANWHARQDFLATYFRNDKNERAASQPAAPKTEAELEADRQRQKQADDEHSAMLQKILFTPIDDEE